MRTARFESGGGGLVSTIDDYIAFSQMLAGGGAPLLSRPTVELLTTILVEASAVKIVATSIERLNLREEWTLEVQGLRLPLEFGLFRHLGDRAGRISTRPELLRGVWGTEFTGGSNVVDAVR